MAMTPAPRQRWRRLPVAIRFLALHALIGFGLATLLAAALLWADPGGVGTLLRRAPGHPGPLLLLWFFLGLTLGAVQSGAALMLLGTPEPPPGPPRGPRLPAAMPVPVPVRRPRRQGSIRSD